MLALVHGSGLEILLKTVIAKAAALVLFAIALLVALVCVWLILRKALRNKTTKTKILAGCVLTPVLTLAFAVAIVWISYFGLMYFVVEPANKRDCIQGMQTIAEASRRWAAEHDGRVPPDLLTLSNYLTDPQVLICPATGQFTDGVYRRESVNYEVAAAGGSTLETNAVLLRCTVHSHRAYGDGRPVVVRSQ